MTRLSIQRGHLLLILALSSTPTYALPTPATLPGWLDSVVPSAGATIADEIQCYSLPYGGLGVISHLLTYWAVYWLGHCRKPYFPFSQISESNFDIGLSLLQTLVTVTVAFITMVRCRRRWQFVLIALWKLVMSLVVGVWGLSSARRAKDPVYWDTRHIYSRPTHTASNAFMWLYFLATGIGLVGLISLVKENFDIGTVAIVTNLFVVFIALDVVGTVLLCMLFRLFECCGYKGTGCCGFWTMSFLELCWLTAILMIALGAFYSDLVLGGLADNMLGFPSGDIQALYWTYFAAKRLPLLFS